MHRIANCKNQCWTLNSGKLKAPEDPKGAAGLIPGVKKSSEPRVLCLVFRFAVLRSKLRPCTSLNSTPDCPAVLTSKAAEEETVPALIPLHLPSVPLHRVGLSPHQPPPPAAVKVVVSRIWAFRISTFWDLSFRIVTFFVFCFLRFQTLILVLPNF